MNGGGPSKHHATEVPGDKDVTLGDVDMIDLLSGCMESQKDIQELFEGLTEMDDELQAMLEDDSFLQFPAILQEAFNMDASSPKDGTHGENTGAIAPSVSSEYLQPGGAQSRNEDQQSLIIQHPLFPVLLKILKKKKDMCLSHYQDEKELESNYKTPFHSSTECKGRSRADSEVDHFLSHTVSVASQLSEDASIGNMMQSVENECSFFTSEMSTFCQNLLKPAEKTPSCKGEPSGVNKASNCNSTVVDSTGKENKSQLKSKSAVSKKRVCLSKRNTQILREWLLEHADNPFPTDSEKDILCLRTGLTLPKLNMWFINSRRRILTQLGLRNNRKEVTQL